jgi:hypothetical protein
MGAVEHVGRRTVRIYMVASLCDEVLIFSQPCPTADSRRRGPSKSYCIVRRSCRLVKEKGPRRPRLALKLLLDGWLNYFCFVVSLFM